MAKFGLLNFHEHGNPGVCCLAGERGCDTDDVFAAKPSFVASTSNRLIPKYYVQTDYVENQNNSQKPVFH